LTRLLTLMGSGETSPTMVKTHRELLQRLGPPPVPAVLLDTPFGFQGNADDLAARAQAYFAESIGQRMDVASFRSAAEVGSVGYEAALGQLREARYVFAGPGSPTYALRQWRESLIPKILHEKLISGGAVTFASAAALTLGIATVPVYEIYKVGAPAAWEEGLDLLAETGLRAAVIPHYNNAEGGNHDTRFCYLGETRLAVMERELPDGAFVLGIDEHTGLVLDLDSRAATVVGIGTVTVRVDGRSTVLETGTVTTIEELAAIAAGAAGAPAITGDAPVSRQEPPESGGGRLESPLAAAIAGYEEAFAEALGGRDVAGAVQVVLDLEAELHGWAADTLQSDDADRGRAALRSMVVRLGDVAVGGARDPREVVGPFVEALLDVRRSARADKRYADSDAVRDALVGLGVEVRDTPAGTEWDLGSPA
jgi:hypothetical protein